MRALWSLRWFFIEHRYRYGAAILMLLGVMVVNMLPPYLTGQLIDEVSTQHASLADISNQLWLLVGAGVLVYLLRYGWRQMLFGTSLRLGAEIRAKLYSRLTQHSPGFYQKQGTGDLMARATNDINAVEMMAGETVLAMVDGLLTGVAVVGVLFYLFPWEMVVAALAPWPILGWLFSRFGKALHRYFAQAQAAFSSVNNFVQQRLSHLHLVRGYGLYEVTEAEFGHKAREASDRNTEVGHVDALYDPVITATIALSFLLALASGAKLVVAGEVTMGQLTTFNLYLGYLIWPMYAMGWMLNLLERGSAALTRIDDLLAIPTEFNESDSTQPKGFKSLQWQIHNFGYDADHAAVLSEVEGRVDAGEVVGVVGPTGAGKSTLIELLTQQYRSQDSHIQLNGVHLHEYNVADLSNRLSIVSQKPFLFSMSIAENIALQKPTASMADIERVAKIASIHNDIVAMSDGYATAVGERGVTLSGGQKQRIAIARALLAESELLVLDDALSAVDVGTERQILDALRSASDQRAMLIVSHRLTALEYADRIYVLDHGHLMAQGTHRELIAQDDTWYQQVYELQRLAEGES